MQDSADEKASGSECEGCGLACASRKEGAAYEKAPGGLLKGVLVLTLICLASGLGVGLLYQRMKNDIQANERSVFLNTLATVLGEAESYDTVGEYESDVNPLEKVYKRDTPSGVLYAASGRARGYQSEIIVLVAVEVGRPNVPVGKDPTIHKMAVVSSLETPGLGERIKDVEKDVSIWGALAGEKSTPGRPRFQTQFERKRLSDLVVVKERQTDRIAAVTGATITSRGATMAVRRAVQRIQTRTQEVYGE
ncbi:MAG: FMN-binding protein [Planctomycetes bacterium]|nr:FMN-binding protein [Planctomycetota bacterium]